MKDERRMHARLEILPTAQDVAVRAAKLIADIIRRRSDAVIIPATGNTPLATYRELASLREETRLDTSRLRIFQLDDYVDVPRSDPRSLYRWMDRAFLRPLGIQPHQVTRLADTGVDPETAFRNYDRALVAAGGADLAILGLGPNGHLGYNEPPSPADAPTRVVTLTPASVASAKAYFAEPVPSQGLTAGMPHLLNAKTILLLVSGQAKQRILRDAIEGPVTCDVPASYLQQRAQAIILADQAAAGENKNRAISGDRKLVTN